MEQSELGSFYKRVDELKKSGSYPLIWKKTPCKTGECLGNLTNHSWSIPMGSAYGLGTECFHCHKTRIVKMDSDPDIWINKPKTEGYVVERLKELNNDRN